MSDPTDANLTDTKLTDADLDETIGLRQGVVNRFEQTESSGQRTEYERHHR